MKLSVVLATFNEERNLPICLKSVKDLADEIIIVDGFSQDKTTDIAREFGAKLIEVPNDPLFHSNKQLAIEKASGDWILQLDADEQVTRELAKEIRSTIEEPNINSKGFYIPRKNWFLGKFLTKGGAYPDPVLRLFKKGKASFARKNIIDNKITTSNVHAQIKVKGEIAYLNNDLIHNSDPSLDKYLKRLNRYTSLEADNLYEMDAKVNLINFISYIFIKPLYWFLKRFIRHRGYVDGFQGFLFALFSALHYPIIYIKLSERYK